MTMKRRTASPKTPTPQIVEISQPRVPAAKSPLRAYVALKSDLELDEGVEPQKTAFFDSIAKVQCVSMVQEKPSVVAKLSAPSSALAERRGYEREDLFAVAEIGYHYLMNGASKLAVTLFEGLTAVAPSEPYFHLALGLSYDHSGMRIEAAQCYERAGKLDPFDPRADLNRAELLIEAADYANAKALLARGAAKAKKKGDEVLAKKADALLRHIARA